MDNKNVSLTTINLFGKREVECILHTKLLAEQEIKASCEVELLKVYKDIDAAVKDVAILEVMSEDNGDIVLCVHTKKMEKIRYYGTNGHLFRFKYGISPEIIKSSAGLGEPNIVKLTCKELGITYRELGEVIGYGGDSLRNIASKAEVSEPLTKAIELYKENLALKIQLQDCNTLKQALKNLIK